MIAASTGATGAYFSDTHAGSISGNSATLTVLTSNLNLAYSNLLPGTDQTVTANYLNTGNVAQDVWVTFPNDTALSALNDLGTYGNMTISSTEGAYFTSSNLCDHSGCTTGVPNQILVASNINPGAGDTVSFTFGYAGKLSNVSQGQPFNIWPAANGTGGGPGSSTSYTHHGDDSSNGTGTGLPYDIVATQHGVAPGA